MMEIDGGLLWFCPDRDWIGDEGFFKNKMTKSKNKKQL